MKVIIFAGGVGSRLWPISRKNTPKQFEKIIGDQSMIQIAVGKLFPDFKWEDIYISTGKDYVDIVKKQLPKLPTENIIAEPAMRDVGPAIGLITSVLVKTDPDEPIALLWGDHLVKEEAVFRKALKVGEEIIKKDPQKIVFIGQTPRFPSQNLGYIAFGEETQRVENFPIYQFKGFKYRPHLSTAEKFVKDGKHSWNLGYFITTPKFLWSLFKDFAPDLYTSLAKISDKVGMGNEFDKVLNGIYPNIEKISFDNAILEKMDPKIGLVISVDIGWSDVGAWEQLKEALSKREEDNVTKGRVSLEDSRDTLTFNYNRQQLVVGIDLDGMLVINTEDVILVCPKNSVPKIKKFVEELAKGPDKKLT
jgi:mannose-1-phosphate guanylyltransferase